MSSNSREDLIQEVVKEFIGVLQLKLPLEHFSQFYDEPHFDNLAQEEAKQVLAKFQASSKLSMEETWAVANELFPRLQEVIRQWKAKNEEKKTECDHFLQSQVDFLLNDFRTYVIIKLVSAPDVGLQDLETFLDRRKIVMFGIFDKLSKPGDSQSCVDKKTRLEEKLDCVKLETLEKQLLHLEQKTTEKAGKVLQDAKEITMELARELKSELESYKGQSPKDLVKEKLEDIDYNLRKKCKLLEEHHPNIYSAVLRTTAEVRKCLDEKDYEDMSAGEFAGTLHEQLLYDFSVESQIGRNSSGMELDSISSSDDDACPVSSNQQEALLVSERNVCANRYEAREGQSNELQIDIVEKEGVKQEMDTDEVKINQDTSELDPRSSNIESALIHLGHDGEESEKEEENDMEESSKIPHDNLEVGRGNPNYSKGRVSKSATNSTCNYSSQRSGEPGAEKRSRPKRRCAVVKTKKPMDDDGNGSNDCADSTSEKSDGKEMDIPVGSKEPDTSKPRHSQARKRHLSFNENGEPRTDKVTYLHLNKEGRPLYRCHVCKRKCFQSQLKYHGENCGTSDDPLTCTECGKTFLKKSNLDMHAWIHTGEKPFKCSKCPVRFAQKGALRRHLRSHARGTLFFLYCKACKLSFISQHRLHSHNMSIHKEKLPFGCRYCDKRFNCMTDLKDHVITHADLRPFKCLTCDTMATNNKYSLASHIQTVHSQSRKAALRQANEAAVAYLVRETKDETYRDISGDKINSLVVAHIIKKANLQLPKRATRKSTEHTSNS